MRSLLLSMLLLVALAGCRTDTPAAPADGDSTAVPSAPAGGPVVIDGDDQMRFSVTDFAVTAGDSVTVTLRNVGGLPKETFGHNFVLLQQTADVEAFLTAAIAAKATDHIPADRQAEVVAHTRLLGPGESDTITFVAPTEPGTYTYVCSFPGHGAMMRGTMTVLPAAMGNAPADSTTATP
jgi:azurin